MENSLLMQATFSCSVMGTVGSRNWPTAVQGFFFLLSKKNAVIFSSVSQMVWPDRNAGVSILVSPRTTLIKNILPSAAITLLLRNKSMKFSCDFSHAFYLWFGYAKVAQVWHKHLVQVVRASLHSLYRATFSLGRSRARQGAAVSGCISAGLAGYNT